MDQEKFLEQEDKNPELEEQLMEEVDGETDDERIKADLLEFAQLFPEAAAHPEDIPDVVWAAVRQGHTLTGAWAAWMIDQLKRRKAPQHTPFPSTGSMRSAGSARPKRDAFLEGLDG